MSQTREDLLKAAAATFQSLDGSLDRLLRHLNPNHRSDAGNIPASPASIEKEPTPVVQMKNSGKIPKKIAL